MFTRHRSLCAVAALLVAGGANAAVLNGSFELSPGVTGKTTNQLTQDVEFEDMPLGGPSWGIWDTLPGWRSGPNHGIEVQTNRTLSTIDAHSGDYYVELDSNGSGSMIQDLFLAAGKYTLSFFYSPRVAQMDTNDITYSVGGLFSGLVGSATEGAEVGSWLEVTQEFMVTTAGNYELGFFADANGDTYGGLLDDVSVEMVAPVPVPAGAVLGLTALASLLMLRRRKA